MPRPAFDFLGVEPFGGVPVEGIQPRHPAARVFGSSLRAVPCRQDGAPSDHPKARRVRRIAGRGLPCELHRRFPRATPGNRPRIDNERLAGHILAMDPREFRESGHALVDRIGDYLEGVEGQALFPDVTPARLDALFDEPLPTEPTPTGDLFRTLDEKLLPYCAHVSHPGYFGLITPTPTPIGILGDLLASALNQNLGVWTIGPSAVAMERRTVRWLDDLVGYCPGYGGTVTSGGMLAYFIRITLTRDSASAELQLRAT